MVCGHSTYIRTPSLLDSVGRIARDSSNMLQYRPPFPGADSEFISHLVVLYCNCTVLLRVGTQEEITHAVTVRCSLFELFGMFGMRDERI